MEIEEYSRLELKSRMLENEARSDLRQVLEIKRSVQTSALKISTLAAQFRMIKSHLAAATPLNRKELPRERLIKANSLQQNLNNVKKLLAQHKEIHATLERNRAQALRKFEITKNRNELIRAKIHSYRVGKEKQINERELEEVLDARNKTAEDPNISGQLSTSEKDAPNIFADRLAAFDPRHSGCPQRQQDSDGNSNAKSIPNIGKNSSSGIAMPIQSEISKLKSWEGLNGAGVSFVVRTRSGRDLGVTIETAGESQLRVNIHTEYERDKRVLWREKEEIVSALEAQGYTVKEFSVRGELA